MPTESRSTDMPYRDWYLPTSPYDLGFDRTGGFHEDRAQMRDTQPRGGQDEGWKPWRCSMCGRGEDAVADCAICGDALDAMEDAA